MTSRKMMQYHNQPTPQSQPVLGHNMVANNAGGFAFSADGWTRLKRFLIIGSEGGTYYQGEVTLTRENAQVVLECLQEDGIRAVNEIVAVSESNAALKQSPVIFALALAAAVGNAKAKQEAFKVLPRVARTASSLMEFVDAVTQVRGWGRGLRNAVSNWYLSKPVGDLAYQVIKYRTRNGWSHLDLLRSAHPRPKNGQQKALFAYLAGKGPVPEDLPQVVAYERLQTVTSVKEAVSIIVANKLPREAVPDGLLKEREVWAALLESMPVMAMIRTLNRLSAVGLTDPFSDSLSKIVGVLENPDIIKKSRLHPLFIYKAMKQYSQGRGDKGSLTWQPSSKVLAALETAFELSFNNVEAIPKKILVGVDVSGSMSSPVNGAPNVSAYEAAAVTALVYIRAQKLSHVILFDTTFHEVRISERTSLSELNTIISRYNGGTDVSQVARYALSSGLDVDGIIQFTDSESWAGNRHTFEVIEQLRKKLGHTVRVVNVQATASATTLINPKDKDSMELPGFGPDVPQLANLFLGGNF